jgi:hypothetical protein
MKAAPEGVAMSIKIHSDLPQGTIVRDENGKELSEITALQMADDLQAVMTHQTKCKADAVECLKFYFNEDNAINIEFLENWLDKNQPLDRWFFVHLIEVAGQILFDKTYSAHRAENARSKNKIPKAWVLKQWQERSDKKQKKAEFASQYALLVKKEFDLIVKPDTIARAWLPKTKK